MIIQIMSGNNNGKNIYIEHIQTNCLIDTVLLYLMKLLQKLNQTGNKIYNFLSVSISSIPRTFQNWTLLELLSKCIMNIRTKPIIYSVIESAEYLRIRQYSVLVKKQIPILNIK